MKAYLIHCLKETVPASLELALPVSKHVLHFLSNMLVLCPVVTLIINYNILFCTRIAGLPVKWEAEILSFLSSLLRINTDFAIHS